MVVNNRSKQGTRVNVLLRRGLLLLSILSMAAIAGFFYAYSSSVMRGLSATHPHTAIEAMQAINATVRNWLFAPSFFGALALAFDAGVVAAATGAVRTAAWTLAGAVVYGGLAFAVTLLINVPMNTALAAAVVPTGAEGGLRVWSEYAAPWSGWNDVRTAASFLALVCLVQAYRVEASEQ
jgi:uncharacterized membrane protein